MNEIAMETPRGEFHRPQRNIEQEAADAERENKRAETIDVLAKLPQQTRDMLRFFRRSYASFQEEPHPTSEQQFHLPLSSFDLSPENILDRSGISFQQAETLARESELATLIKAAETQESERRIDAIRARHQSAKMLAIQMMGVGSFGFSDEVVRLSQELEEGVRTAAELAPLPEKGTFVLLEDTQKGTEPVRIYERQTVRTERDIESPHFSSCAAVALFRRNPDGTPQQETIFAHLPPKTAGITGGPASFASYDASFFKEKLGLASLEGYAVRICSGLNTSPDELARNLQKLGAKIEFAEQLPLDMYTVRLDARTKTMVAMGKAEFPARQGDRISYTTENGIPIKISDNPTIMEVKPLT